MFISIYAIPKCHKLISWNCLHITGRFYSSTASRRRQRLPQLKSGHNLTSRGELLTKTIQRQLKQKEDVNNNNYNNVNSGSTSGEIEVASIGDPGMTLGMPVSKVFRGMIVPEKPIPPGPDDCCMSGCAICVYDLYITSLETYRDSLKSIRTALASKSVPVSEWPEGLQEELDLDNKTPRQDPDSGVPNSGLDTSLLAFAELEKGLRLKKEE